MGEPSGSELLVRLRRSGVRDVDASTLTRALYSSDASLYRVVPAVVVRPHDPDEVLAVLDTCRSSGVGVTARGAGTSVAGNAVGPGVVLDFSRHMTRVVSIDPEAGVAIVEPGVVHSDLQRAARSAGLRFGPDPSSGSRCTIGGMIGNNACGTRALEYGRTSDNVVALDLATAAGRVTALRTGQRPSDPAMAAVVDLAATHLATIRTQFGRFSRQASGYSLEHLLPENGADLVQALVGSEGTLAIAVRAELRLVPEPSHTALVVLGFATMAEAADAVPAVLAHRPTACEGLDSRIVEAVRSRRGPRGIPSLPHGGGWLFVEVTGASAQEAGQRAADVARAVECVDQSLVDDQRHVAALWRLRENGAGLSGVSPAGRPAHAGWEDAAVPPDRLGAYLREFETLMMAHGLTGLPYGHFGDGCVHVRIDFPLTAPGGSQQFHGFLLEAARLVVAHGGSLSGEHGDGRARGELLEIMYSAQAIALMAQVKGLLDPEGLLNPGVIVRPAAATSDLRVVASADVRGLPLTLVDGGDLVEAVHRCTGVGRCRVADAAPGNVMCPSFVATHDEKDSTRGRARALQEMVNGTLVTGGWRSREVHDALDLCLSCKGCLTDCPTGIDMAAYKAEVLYRSYRRRPRPRAHYTLGWLPRWAPIAARFPRIVNALLSAPRLGHLARLAAGVDRRAPAPVFARRTFRRRQAAGGPQHQPARTRVVLWVDTFTDHFSPEVGEAAVLLLQDAGYDVELSPPGTCCSITWISTGQLDAARRRLRHVVDALLPSVTSGALVVGLEPSCTAVLRSELASLVGSDDARTVSAAVRTLAELLIATPGWTAPRLDGEIIVAQPHCHHAAVLGWDADAGILADSGADVRRVGSCCGLAGNFGVEAGHREVSVAIASNALLPAIEAAGEATAEVSARQPTVLADGFSCRLQVDNLTGVGAVHLAQLLTKQRPTKAT